ncbi:hypothetical protein MYCSP_12675 [Mycobacteroides saopaulense]|uniref:FAD-dependent oxidoreductase n=1 Tax=Mycobacteroides saopaulense TaxID=1578165 RepID=UPI0007230632|nr:FAD-dependent oxidoreductase [Mycobacteroides saopaulense]ALR12133.1 hypothetical protein MYCSP_12675 [Mycobacteroides saopaulense]
MPGVAVDVCVIGGGPAGLMAGLLLARFGLDVTVVEKHSDFLRDFRGDTVHPSTLQAMDELGLIDQFLELPHAKAETLPIATDSGQLLFADFRALPGRYRYLAFMPQWDVLDFVASAARRYPGFELLQQVQATELIHEGEDVVGVRASGPGGVLQIRAKLVIAADGRRSLVRSTGELGLAASTAPMDVLWFRLSRAADDPVSAVRSGRGYFIVCLNRGHYWQIAYMIPKGGYEQIRREGLDALKTAIAAIYPVFAGRLAEELDDWSDFHLLDVRVDRLRRWYRPGLLAIGDAAHAMSPAGGVGINLAVQDAVAAARMLGPVLASGARPSVAQLARVQRRRQYPAQIVQWAQLYLLADLYPTAGRPPAERPLLIRLIRAFPLLPRLIARVIGRGLRPEPVPPPAVGMRSESMEA